MKVLKGLRLGNCRQTLSKKAGVAILLFALSIGYAEQGKLAEVSRETSAARSFSLNYNAVWEGVLKSVELKGFTPRIAEREAGLVSFSMPVVRHTGGCQCPAMVGVNSYDLDNVNIVVEKRAQDVTRVSIGRTRPGGLIEDDFLNTLEKVLGVKGFDLHWMGDAREAKPKQD